MKTFESVCTLPRSLGNAYILETKYDMKVGVLIGLIVPARKGEGALSCSFDGSTTRRAAPLGDF